MSSSLQRFSRTILSTRVLTTQKPPFSPIRAAFLARSMASTTPQEAPVRDETRPKRPFNGNHRGGNGGRFQKKIKKAKVKPAKEGSSEEVLMADIEAMLAKQKLDDDQETPVNEQDLPQPGTEIEVEVLSLSSTGDGLAVQPGRKQIYVVKYAVPGDIVKIKVYRHLLGFNHSIGDYISVVKPSPMRDDARISCKHFTNCGGCQFQMLSYADQLAHKRTIVERAFANFSSLPPELIPAVDETMGSPLQMGYRTKLTPHFDAPPGSQFGSRRRRRDGEPPKVWESVPPIGFVGKGSRRTIDIEDCPIGTDAVRAGMKRERARVAANFSKYERGATILLRENTQRVPKGEPLPEPLPEDAVVVARDDFTDVKNCITDSNATSREHIDDFIFTSPAGSFFQNNNSILPSFTDYIRKHIMPPPKEGVKPIKYLIDAYSGSGLFTITLSSLFSGGSIGIDIDDKSIEYARTNARLNNLPTEQCSFIAADATQLFKSVSAFDPDETVVVLDPPRKGCNGSFLRQLLNFAPRRVVYVSCNVHTQARDVGIMVRGEVTDMGEDPEELEQYGRQEPGKPKARYDIETIRGFDFFPQTGHVEGVAILNRVDQDLPKTEAGQDA